MNALSVSAMTRIARTVLRRAGDVSPLMNRRLQHREIERQGIDIPRSPKSVAIILCLLFVAGAGHSVVADDATLMWSNGDALKGELVEADEASIVWKSPLFNDPLRIRMPAISSVTFPVKKDGTPEPNLYRILMRNGDVLFGQLKAADEETLTFAGPRFGTFQLLRTGVLGIQKSSGSGGGILYSGPRGLEGWQPAFRRSADQANNGPQMVFGNVAIGMGIGGIGAEAAKSEAEKKVSAGAWTELPDGSIRSAKTDAALFLPQKFPDRYELELELHSKKGLQFVLAFGRDTKNGLRIESWINVLVAARGTNFVSLMNIPEIEQTVHLHLFVDHKAKKMSVFSHAGERFGEIDLNGLRGLEGVTLRNGEGELTLKKLSIRGWDGSDPQIDSGSGTQFHLVDGSKKSATLKSVNSETGAITMNENGTDVELTFDQLSSISFAMDAAAVAQERGATQLIWSDGGYVSGSLKSIQNGEASILTNYAKEPLRCRLENALRLGMTPGTLDEVQTDRLFHAGKTLQGSLVVDGEADRPIQWKPLGGLSASTLRNGSNARFVRGSEVKHFSEQPEQLQNFPDVLYLKNNDVIPCHFESMTETNVHLTTPFSDARSFAKDKIRAIELGATGRIHQRGFSDPGWKGIAAKQQVRDKLTFRGTNRYSHPSILTGDTIRFRLRWPLQSYSNLTMSLYGTGSGTDKSASHICFSIMQAMLQISDQAPKQNNQFIFRGFGGQNPNELIRAPKGDVQVQIVALDGKLLVSIDGKQVKSFKLNPAGAGLKGLAFSAHVQNMGNVVINGRVQQSDTDGIEISDFEIDNLAGASVRQFIEEEVRQMALTVPRFRRDSPPTHVLVAANGDLLRGRLVGISESDIQFESRLENVRLDRSRIAAVVFLDPPPKEAAEKLTRPKKGTADTATAQDGLDVVKVQTPEGVDVLEVTGKVPAVDANGQPIGAASEKSTADEDQDAFVINDESATSGDGTIQAQLADGFSLTMIPVRLENGQIKATSTVLGNCSFPAASIRELSIGNPADREVTSAYEQWIARNAPEPDWDIPAADGGSSAGAQMIGKAADDFQLTLLDGTQFRLSEHKDKIIVLDFWATWCGPCVAALPDYIAATGHFKNTQVMFVAVNQQEAPDQIRRFLEEKQMAPMVALDRDGAIGQKFQVSGIPHTVIIGPGGIIEDVHVGYQAGAGEHMQLSIQQMLDGTWKRPDPNAPKEEKNADKEPDGV